MRIIALILAIYCAHKGTAQSLLNGSFEDKNQLRRIAKIPFPPLPLEVG